MAAPITYSNFSYKFHSETLLGKLIRLPLWLIPKGIPVRIRTGVARGMRWHTGAHVHGCWLGTYEFEKQVFCEEMIKPGMTVFDIGANAGFYTLLFSRLIGRGGQVISFEPDSENICLLRKHIALNKLENVSVVQAAVSDATALVGFSLTGGATGCFEKNSSYLVPTLRLDELLADGYLRSPDVIKMDVEGAEVMVLRGANDFIEKKTCSWIVALHGDEAKDGCLGIFSKAGYLLQDLRGQRIDPINFPGDEFVAIPR